MNPAPLRANSKLIFYPEKNKALRKDAQEFRAEALRFSSAHFSGTMFEEKVDNHQPLALQEERVRQAIAAWRADDIVFFCHGYKTGLQFGFKGPVGARRLAGHVAQSKTEAAAGFVRCIFYCCSIAQDEDNWFNWFCDALERHELRYVCIGHATAGHTTKNPYVKVRSNTASYAGAAYLVRPGCPRWADWRTRLLAHADFRFRFPYLGADEVTRELGGMTLS